MEYYQKLHDFIYGEPQDNLGKFMAIVVLVIAALALFVPVSCTYAVTGICPVKNVWAGCRTDGRSHSGRHLPWRDIQLLYSGYYS